MHFAPPTPRRSTPRTITSSPTTRSKKVNLPSLVIRASEAADATAVLAELEPQSDDYRRLIAALAAWRRIAADTANDAPRADIPSLSFVHRLP